MAANRVIVVMSNDETTATTAWKTLVAEAVPNVYILQGGINNWLTFFGKDDPVLEAIGTPVPDEGLRFTFPAALGDRYASSAPSLIEYDKLTYVPKIVLQIQRDKTGGGCG